MLRLPPFDLLDTDQESGATFDISRALLRDQRMEYRPTIQLFHSRLSPRNLSATRQPSALGRDGQPKYLLLQSHERHRCESHLLQGRARSAESLQNLQRHPGCSS